MRRRVVITGMGAITPVGLTAEETWQNLRSGVVGIAPVEAADIGEHQVKVAGQVKGFVPESIMDRMEARRTARFTQFAIKASLEAFEQSGLQLDREDPLRCGVNIGSGIGALPVIEEACRKGAKHGFDRISPLFIPMTIVNMAAGAVAIRLGFKGSCTCSVTACASGTNAIGESFHAIRDGYADVMVAGGTEACISDLGLGGFTSMRALTTETNPLRASIPFDKERGGFVLGEGAGILILEEYEHARKRDAAILGEIVGYGASCDANHMTAPLEDGSGAAACMQMAMADGDVSPEQVGYINAHGTGTPLNDRCETAAVKLAFGDASKTVVISSTKSMTGHLLGGSGGVEAIATAKMLSDQFAPPTAGYRIPDENCDLDVCPNNGKRVDTEYAMSNSLGFGGHNASLLFRRIEKNDIPECRND